MEKSNINKQALLDFLKDGKRFDGRKENEFRELTIEYPVSNKAEGSVRVRLGKPAMLYIDGRKREAILLISYTIGILFLITLMAFIFLAVYFNLVYLR